MKASSTFDSAAGYPLPRCLREQLDHIAWFGRSMEWRPLALWRRTPRSRRDGLYGFAATPMGGRSGRLRLGDRLGSDGRMVAGLLGRQRRHLEPRRRRRGSAELRRRDRLRPPRASRVDPTGTAKRSRNAHALHARPRSRRSQRPPPHSASSADRSSRSEATPTHAPGRRGTHAAPSPSSCFRECKRESPSLRPWMLARDEVGAPAPRSRGRSLRQRDANAGRQELGRSVVVRSEHVIGGHADARSRGTSGRRVLLSALWRALVRDDHVHVL